MILQNLQPLCARTGLELGGERISGARRIAGKIFPTLFNAQSLEHLQIEVGEKGSQEKPLPVRALVEAITWRGAERLTARQGWSRQNAHRSRRLGKSVKSTDRHRLTLATAVTFQERRADSRGAHDTLRIPKKRQNQMHGLVLITTLSESHAAQRGQQAVVRRNLAPSSADTVGRHPGMDEAAMGRG